MAVEMLRGPDQTAILRSLDISTYYCALGMAETHLPRPHWLRTYLAASRYSQTGSAQARIRPPASGLLQGHNCHES